MKNSDVANELIRIAKSLGDTTSEDLLFPKYTDDELIRHALSKVVLAANGRGNWKW